MINYTLRKRNKANSYKRIRENIHLNQSNVVEGYNVFGGINQQKDWLYQCQELKSTNDCIQNSLVTKSSKSSKILINWWEN